MKRTVDLSDEEPRATIVPKVKRGLSLYCDHIISAINSFVELIQSEPLKTILSISNEDLTYYTASEEPLLSALNDMDSARRTFEFIKDKMIDFDPDLLFQKYIPRAWSLDAAWRPSRIFTIWWNYMSMDRPMLKMFSKVIDIFQRVLREWMDAGGVETNPYYLNVVKQILAWVDKYFVTNADFAGSGDVFVASLFSGAKETYKAYADHIHTKTADSQELRKFHNAVMRHLDLEKLRSGLQGKSDLPAMNDDVLKYIVNINRPPIDKKISCAWCAQEPRMRDSVSNQLFCGAKCQELFYESTNKLHL